MSDLPLLYSFRRCPYAMRARLALAYCKVEVELREVVLRNKPAELINASAKATVPVLVLNDGKVIDESFDIMMWAISTSTNYELLSLDNEAQQRLITSFDREFKPLLDRYKYFQRYPEYDQSAHRHHAVMWLQQLEQGLCDQTYLMGDKLSLVDLACFPFVRQFAHVDKPWFFNSDFIELKRWLLLCIESELFLSIMKKYLQWHSSDPVQVFP